MDNMMQVFDSERFGQVRVVMRESEPWFAATDVCKALDVSNPTMALNRLDNDEKMTLSSNEGHSGQRGGAQLMSWVNEPGLYTLVLGSRKPEAKAFKRWITHEVIPSLRKHGAYVVGQDNMDESELIAKALIAAKSVLDERERRLREALYAGEVDDVRTLLPGSYYLDEDADEPCITTDMDVIYDANYDLPALWGYEVCDEAGMPMSTVNRDEAGNLLPTSATYYKINETTIIVPHNWH